MSTVSSPAQPPATRRSLDPSRLAQLDARLARFVDSGLLPGWQIAISQHGELTHFSSYGRRDVESDLPVADDTIFRLYSMTKPITAVAALRLWERGEFLLNEPVAKYLPAFAHQKVWRSGTSTKPELEPVTETMRIWHLFAHMSGLTYGFANAHPVDGLYRQAGLEWGVPAGLDLAGVCDLIASLPLLFQPGTAWNYGMSTDVLGMVVEAIAGRPFADVVQDEVLDPLGMDDTSWFAPDEKVDRLAALYTPSPADGTAVRLDAFGDAAKKPPAASLGGGGLVGTTSDYVRFANMLAGRGALDGTRILAPSTVDYMATNHLPGNVDLEAVARPFFSETTYDGVGFGLGVSVVIDPAAAKVPYSRGEFGWGGAASTTFWVDPELDMTVVFMTQLLPSDSHPIRPLLRSLVKAALVD
ncbi:serine hydrolase domain-containing protein [Desertimonas flava]|jgi:CubicO group peptidase (beta-lactamase class C family)|uniref:serine hydrolase domain-containing protein n=1 Tax=Desertimonas flava TaxID=2064846 RepID=UPI000E3410AF|nr:serine hydrolase domain-containing protein [Desertimonas flava]